MSAKPLIEATRSGAIIFPGQLKAIPSPNNAISRWATTVTTVTTAAIGGRFRKKIWSDAASSFIGRSTGTGVLFVSLSAMLSTASRVYPWLGLCLGYALVLFGNPSGLRCATVFAASRGSAASGLHLPCSVLPTRFFSSLLSRRSKTRPISI